MRPLVATLAGTGLRVGEAIALDLPDINLATRTLGVGKAKSDAGTYREVYLPAGPIEALSEWKARHVRRVPSARRAAFVTRTGRRQTVTNVDRRMKTLIRRANRRLAEIGIAPISERVTPHSLRRTYASLRAAAGDDPVFIAEQLGHEDARFTFRVYQKAVKRRERLDGVYLEEFDRALEWAQLGTIGKSASGRSKATVRRKNEIPLG
jgi:integrase